MKIKLILTESVSTFFKIPGVMSLSADSKTRLEPNEHYKSVKLLFTLVKINYLPLH